MRRNVRTDSKPQHTFPKMKMTKALLLIVTLSLAITRITIAFSPPITEQQVIGEWRTCGSAGKCTVYTFHADHAWSSKSTDGTMSSGKWSISGNRLLLHFAASTAHPRAAGMTTPLIVTDISPKNMHTKSLKGDTQKHLWERIR